MSDGGKGSAPRPMQVSNEEYASRWDAIFAREPKTVSPEAEAALQEMTKINEELGLYSDPKPE